MSNKKPLRRDDNYLFAEFQAGETIGIEHGGLGASTIDGVLSTVGNTTAQWNASSIQGSPVSANLSPSSGQSLVYDGSRWTASTVSVGGSGATALSGLTDTTIAAPASNDVLTWDGSKWVPAAPPGAGGGEANTASNLGSGQGLYSSKVGVDLQFRSLSGINVNVTTNGNVVVVSAQTSAAFTSNAQIDHGSIGGLGDNDHPQYVLSATNSTLSSNVANHIASSTVHFTAESLSSTPGYVLSATNSTLSSNVSNHIASSTVHFTEASINHANIQNIGTNTHAQIDTHIANTSNPHSVTPTQVGNTTAQWNASALRGTSLSATLVPLAGQGLIYNGSVWTASTISVGGGVTDHGALTGLADDDHPQYVLSATNSTLSSNVSNHIASSTVHFTSGSLSGYYAASSWTELRYAASSHNHALSTLTDTSIAGPIAGQILTWGGSNWTPSTSPAGVTNHSLLTNLNANDHPQYVLSATNSTLSSNVANHIASSTVHFTQTEIDHGTIGGLSDNDHPQYVLSATNNALSSLVTSIQTSTVNLSGYIGSNESAWSNAGITSINSQTGAAQTITAGSGLVIVQGTNTLAVGANNTSSIWNASALRGVALSSTLAPTNGNVLVYSGSVFIVSSKAPNAILADLATNATTADVATNVAILFQKNLLDVGPVSNGDVMYFDAVEDKWTVGASSLFAGSSAGVTDHGALTGLTDNDHPQYVLSATNNTLSSLVANIQASTVALSGYINTNQAGWVNDPPVTINTETGPDFTIDSGAGISVSVPATNTIRVAANNTSGIWNASALNSVQVSGTPSTGQVLAYDGAKWTPSSVPTGSPGGGLDQIQVMNLILWRGL